MPTPALPLIVDQFASNYRRGDSWGGAFDPPTDPLAAPGVREDAQYIYRDIPLTTFGGPWSIDTIRGALQHHREGIFQQPALLSEAIFGDDRVQATLGSRTGGLFSREVQHYRGGSGRKYSHRAYRAWVQAWPQICPQSVMSEIMRWVIILGFAIVELRWDRTVEPWMPYLVPWNPYFDQWRWDLRKHQLSTIDGPVAAIPGQGKFMVFAPHGQYRGWIQGALRAIAEIWLMKRLAWRDWARWNERHGLPVFKAKVPAAGDKDQKAAFVNSLHRLGKESVIGLPQNVDGTGYDAELLEARDRGWETFGSFIDRADRSIVLPILWQNLTTEVKEGSFAAARVHGDVRQNALEFDNETLSEAIYQQIARPWAYFNFGDPDVAPYSCWDVTPVEDFGVKADVLLKFGQALNQLRQAGLQARHVRMLARRFGLDGLHVQRVDATMVEARLAGATGEEKDSPESRSALRAALRDVRRTIRHLDDRVAA
jgi:hypothetical protein